jgi:hypothetical protein
MEDRDRRRADRLSRVQTFGRENPTDFAGADIALEALTSIDDILEELGPTLAEQVPSRVSKATLLDALNLDFKLIAKTARAIEKRAKIVSFAAPYAVPSYTETDIRTHAERLLGLLEDAATDTDDVKTGKAALRQRFLAYAIAADFVTDLRADYEALRNADAHNKAEVQTGVLSTARIGELLATGSDDVAQIDAIASNLFARQADKLHSWRRASRVERDPQRQKDAPSPTPPVAPGA